MNEASLDNDQLDAHLFYNTFIIFLYTFQALHAHHQEAKLYGRSVWYGPLSQWPPERLIPDAASIQFSLLMISM